MSHFTVGVITDSIDEKAIEEILAPYSENLEVPPYIDITKEEIINNAKQRKNEYLKAIEKGEQLKDWQLEYINANTDEELYNLERYETEEFDENGNQLSRYNPLSKWDWWQIGGRWSGELCVKGNWANYGKIKDIEFDKMPDNKQKIYDNAILFWELFVDEREPINDKEKEFKQNEFCLYKKEYYINRYGSKENYASSCATWSTHSFVDDNGWHECGDMLWWGMDDSTKYSEALYRAELNKALIDPKNQDKYLVIVDCHI